MALSFEQALPLIQQQTGNPNIMDALALYNRGTFTAPAAAPVPTETPQAFLNLTAPAPAPTPAPTGIAALTPAPAPTPFVPKDIPQDVAGLYSSLLDRDPTKTGDKGYEWWQKEIGSDGITADEYKRFLAAAAPEMVTRTYKGVLGRDIPQTDTGLDYYVSQLRSGAIRPENLISSVIGGARNADVLAAQEYNVLGTPASYGEFEKIRPSLEKNLGLEAGYLSTQTPQDFATKSAEEIQNILKTSGANKYQEASRMANIAQRVYGLTDEQSKQIGLNLIKGTESNQAIKDYYNALLQGESVGDAQQKLIQDAYKKNPQSQYFKDNPKAELISKPIGEAKRGEETSNTYGVDPESYLPILHKDAFNEALGKEAILAGPADFTNFTKQQWIGADPHSRYGGVLARGIGALGVRADKDEISDFNRIEKEIAKFGGIQKETGPEGGDDYVLIPEPGGETRKVRVVDLFDTGGEFNYNGFDRYKLYQDTKQRMDQIASDYKIDPTKYKDTKDFYDAIDDKFKDLYIWQGRTDTLDPRAAKTLGIEDTKDNQKHALIKYQAVGDKLVPVQVLKTFDFQDPNTTSGFFGDLAQGIMSILSVPPIAMALGAAGGLPGLISEMAGISLPSIATDIGTSILTSLGADAATAAAYAPIVGNMLLSGTTSGLMGSAAAGDLSKFGEGFTTGAVRSGISGLGPKLGFDPSMSNFAGSLAAAKLNDQDLEKFLANQIMSTGIKSLFNATKPTAGTAR